MQITMTMEEYTNLITANAKHVEQLNKLIEKYDRLEQLKNKNCNISLNLTLDELDWILSWSCVSFNEFGFEKEEQVLYEKLCDLKEQYLNGM